MAFAIFVNLLLFGLFCGLHGLCASLCNWTATDNPPPVIEFEDQFQATVVAVILKVIRVNSLKRGLSVVISCIRRDRSSHGQISFESVVALGETDLAIAKYHLNLLIL